MEEVERELLLEAFDSNWIAPLGPHVDAFEREFAEAIGIQSAVALSSGTAALHLALVALGVGPGDEVILPSLTFVATANAVRYVGALPIFLDSDRSTWNIDPDLLELELEERARGSRTTGAVIAVDLYGQCADYSRIASICKRFRVPLIEDAAEALGATYGELAAGTLGDIGVFSFNGNKIITTSGGGMLVCSDDRLTAHVRHLASQARDPARHYQHSSVGYNYRMSNLLAAIGRGQLQALPSRVERRRAVNAAYRRILAGEPGIDFMPASDFGRPTWWLTCLTVDAGQFGASNVDIQRRLETYNIESRPTWKPMHLQPVYCGFPMRRGSVAEDIFSRGICLPSGSNLDAHQVDMIGDIILTTPASMGSSR